MKVNPISRRAALLKLGGLATVAYTVPAMTTLSAARASDASAASPASAGSAASAGSSASDPSPTSDASDPSPASDPSEASGPSMASLRDSIVDGPSCEAAGGRYDAASNVCTVRR